MGSYAAYALPSCKRCSAKFNAVERLRVPLMLLGLFGFVLLLFGGETIGWRLIVIGTIAHAAFWLFRTLPLATAVDFWLAKYCVLDKK